MTLIGLPAFGAPSRAPGPTSVGMDASVSER